MIHKFKNNGMNLVLDVSSGAVHQVSDTVYELLDSEKIETAKNIDDLFGLDNSGKDYKDLKEAFDEIKQLQNEGLLFSEDPYEKIAKNVKANHVIKALCLHIAHDCNLRCEYCFADKGTYHENRSMMSFDVAKAAIDFVVESSETRRNIEIDFFGGEPLMNFDVVKKTIQYARSLEEKRNKKFRFTITTNGVLLSQDKIDFINENMDNVVLSLDGRKEVNDKVRKCVNGGSSYDLILDKFKALVKNRTKDYYVRGTFTSYNLDFSKDVLHIVDQGFKNTSIEPVVASDDKPYVIREEHVDRIFDEYDKLASEYVKRRKEGHPFTFFHFMVDLENGPCVIKRLRGCGAGCEYLAVTPDGELYPCHQFVGNSDFKIGDINQGIQKPELIEEFAKVNVYSKDTCKNCWAKFYCSGGCLANAYAFNQDLNMPYEIGCKLLKKRLECAIMIQAALL